MFARIAVLGTALIASITALPARANVICAVVERGRTTCTYFCQNGYTCDLTNRKCLPGPEILKKVRKLLDEASQSKRNLNGDKIKERNAKEAQMFGNQRGEYYYRWDGNPKEMPTPRYRPYYRFAYAQSSPGGYAPVRRTSSSAPSRYVVRSYLETLLTSAQRLPAGDPARASIIATARALVASNNVSFDVDDFFCHSAALPAALGHPASSVTWTVPGIEQEVLERGMCADAADAKSQCVARNFGLVVLDVEPDIKARCKAQEQDPQEQKLDALAECADRTLRNAWSQSAPRLVQSKASAEQCPPPAASPSRRNNAEDLRRRLRAALAARGEAGDAVEDEAPAPVAAQPSGPAKAAEQLAADPDIDEAFCAYIARKSVRGELTSGDGTPIPDYCKKALDSARSCTEQSCSMADVIAEEERRQKSNALPWGAADREKIAALQKPLLESPVPDAAPQAVSTTPPTISTAPTVHAPAPTVAAPTTPPPMAAPPPTVPRAPTVSAPTTPAPVAPTTTVPTTPPPMAAAPLLTPPSVPTVATPTTPAPSAPTTANPTMPPPMAAAPPPSPPSVPTVATPTTPNPSVPATAAPITPAPTVNTR